MTKPNYIQAFTQIIADIEEHNALEILEKKLIPNQTDLEDIIYDCKDLNYSLAPNLLEYYQQVQHFELEWRLKGGYELDLFNGEDVVVPVRGSIRIEPYWQILEEERWEESIWFEGDVEEKQLRPFDYFNNDLSGSACLYVNDEGTITDDLFFFSHEGGYRMEDAEGYIGGIKSGLNIKEYVHLLTITRGYSIWQRVYEARKQNISSLSEERYLHYMGQLFEQYVF